ncbi:type VI secretion system-associated FHA domain protein TagH [Burkholderia sp. Ac-20384]|uniref:type VI secretion system-associated FHA domain protein TagH n=1 Tax=Burkholderia sp. Ac-20384 TaxID=2703902 RepID=UPI00197DFFD0|nr:type VI secretion system-associated FHA domain protein TagH [Burkholderia sp. Ac-20384]MBN3824852.1 type VI secretion system-associated FHA domain protein TagH [Burkholderia sp. Ac-20384]
MNPVITAPHLALVVSNPQALQQGTAPRHSFDMNGGTIGSQNANWTLHDRAGRVQSQHCEIRFEDGGYLVIDRCGDTRVNDQTRPLGLHASARLRNADTLHVGPYRLSVHLDVDAHTLPDPSRVLAQHDVTELLQPPDDYLSSLPIIAADPGQITETTDPDWAAFQALGESVSSQGQLDPLQALDLADSQDTGTALHTSLDPRHYGATPLAAQADVATTPQEAFHGSPVHVSGAPIMSEQDHVDSAARAWLNAQHAPGQDAAGLVNPLIEGLGAPVGALNAHAAYALLFEAGRSLSAVIHGLSELHRGAPGQIQGQAFAARTLQPIEDNPLRLGQSYPDTVRAMFAADRSLVHLSPAAAIEESLEQLQRQQRATRRAITAGLSALLQAFSPEQLQRRFARYRPPQAVQANHEGWPWRMYGHYYEELVSSRQQGFDKLFWEVFEQAYDQAMRTEAQ